MLRWFDKIPLAPLAVAAVLLGLSPSLSEPHLWQKLRLLSAGGLDQPIDVLDLVLHASLPLALVLKLIRLRGLDRHRPT